MAMGWVGTETQRSAIMTGSRSTSAPTNSKDRLPEPLTIEARNSSSSRTEERRMPPPEP
jgi:hypothetical protein